MENEELIRQDMERTRESLTEKLETLECKVADTVQQASCAVNETVSNVKESVHEGVESVKDAMDITAHVDRHPWLMFGGAVVTGMVAGNLLLGQEKRGSRFEPEPSRQAPVPFRASQTAETPTSTSNGWLAMLDPEIQKLKGLALGVTLGLVREALVREVPKPLATYVGDIIDDVTRKVGGKPMSGPFTKAQESNGATSSSAWESAARTM